MSWASLEAVVISVLSLCIASYWLRCWVLQEGTRLVSLPHKGGSLFNSLQGNISTRYLKNIIRMRIPKLAFLMNASLSFLTIVLSCGWRDSSFGSYQTARTLLLANLPVSALPGHMPEVGLYIQHKTSFPPVSIVIGGWRSAGFMRYEEQQIQHTYRLIWTRITVVNGIRRLERRPPACSVEWLMNDAVPRISWSCCRVWVGLFSVRLSRVFWCCCTFSHLVRLSSEVSVLFPTLAVFLGMVPRLLVMVMSVFQSGPRAIVRHVHCRRTSVWRLFGTSACRISHCASY